MRIILESKKNIKITTLPELISGNYWILDNNSKNLLNVVEENGKLTAVTVVENDIRY